MDAANPFAPPAADSRPAGSVPEALRLDAAALAEARRRLDLHLRDPDAVAADRTAEGRRVRVITWTFLALPIIPLAIVLLTPVTSAGSAGVAVIVGLIVAIALAVPAVLLLAQDLRVVPRSQAVDPVRALDGWLRACRLGRGGYLRSCLAPTARECTLAAPDLTPVVAGPGLFPADDPTALTAWVRTFARPGHGQVRWFSSRRMHLVAREGDLATVQVEVRSASWPQWANIVSVVLFLVVRVIGLVVGLVLFFTLRKRRTLVITKHLLCGRDGCWYLLDGGLDDGAAPLAG